MFPFLSRYGIFSPFGWTHYPNSMILVIHSDTFLWPTALIVAGKLWLLLTDVESLITRYNGSVIMYTPASFVQLCSLAVSSIYVTIRLCGHALGQSTNIPQAPRPKWKCRKHITILVDFNFFSFFLVSAFYVWHQLSEFPEPLILC